MQRESLATSEMDSLLAATCSFEFTGPAVYRKDWNGFHIYLSSWNISGVVKGAQSPCARFWYFWLSGFKAVQEHWAFLPHIQKSVPCLMLATAHCRPAQDLQDFHRAVRSELCSITRILGSLGQKPEKAAGIELSSAISGSLGHNLLFPSIFRPRWKMLPLKYPNRHNLDKRCFKT